VSSSTITNNKQKVTPTSAPKPKNEGAKKARSSKKTPPRGFLRIALDAIIAAASWVSVIALWTCAASAYVSPATFRLAAVCGLGFPLALGGTIFVFFLSLIFAPRKCWISLLGCILCFGSIRSYCPLNFFQSAHKASKNALRVMNFNACNFANITTEAVQGEKLRDLQNQFADIICIEEGSGSLNTWADQHPEFKERYPYIEIAPKTTQITCCSRYPIERTQIVTQHETNAAVAYWIRMPDNKQLLIVNCHLKTNHLSYDERTQYSEIVHNPKESSEKKDSTYLKSRHLAGKIANAAQIRALMADTIADYIAQYPDVPKIVCGDFNETPISYSCYRIKSKGLDDAYRTVGQGMGRSFNRDAIAVRIDHQFYSKDFKPINARIENSVNWSDHYPLIVTYEWTK